MNSDMARICRAAQNAQPAVPGAALALPDIVKAVVQEMLNPSDTVVANIDDYIQFCAEHGRFIREIAPEDGQIAAASFVGGCRAFLREED